MNITIKTSVKNIEAANCILGQAIKIIRESEGAQHSLGLTTKNCDDAEKFRKALLKAFLNPPPEVAR